MTLKLVLFVYFCIYAVYALTMALVARRTLKRQQKVQVAVPWEAFAETPVTIIVPAFNEAVVLEGTLRNLTQQRYPNYTIVVVNDGSTDGTLELLQRLFPLAPRSAGAGPLITQKVRRVYTTRGLRVNVIVVDKENGGKADAFNAALNVVETPYVVTVDADTLLVPTALQELMAPVLRNADVVAVGAQVGVINNSELNQDGSIATIELPKKWLQGVQALEYLKTFMIYRTGHDVVGATLLISGACGMFKTDLLLHLGGFDADSICEDIELTMRIQREIRKLGAVAQIEFVGNPVAWTQVPATFSDLNKQRNRWYRGAAHALWKYRDMLLKPKMGYVGFFTLPAYWLFGYLTPFTLLLLSYVLARDAMAVHSAQELGLLVLIGILVAMLINLTAISLLRFTTSPTQTNRDKVRLFWYGLVEVFFVQFVYVFINLKAAFDALRGKRGWNKFPRTEYHFVKEPTDV